MYGAEKLQWYEGEVEVDAEQAGCFAERLLQLGLVVDGVTPEYGAWGGTPVERTKGSPSVRFGADKEDGAFPLACQVTFWVMGYGVPARLHVPPHLKSRHFLLPKPIERRSLEDGKTSYKVI